MKTHYAPAERDDTEKVIRQYTIIHSFTYLKEMIDALPYVVTILNDKRQVVYSNEALLKQLKAKDLRAFLGRRPGEILQCTNSDCESGCGTSQNCRICGAVNTIMLSMMENRKVVDECRINSLINGEEMAYDFEVTASPFRLQNEKFIIFSLSDISGEKRKKVLERIFFHDILNTAGNVKGITDLVLELDQEDKRKEMLILLQKVSNELVDEIMAQKQLVSAENGELIPRKESVKSIDILKTVSSQFTTNRFQQAKILIHEDSDNVEFVTDPSLLSRIIKNMIKNAIEASRKEDEVITGVKMSGKYVRFFIQNKAYIPPDVQIQIFSRSFSTKGSDRGLGTYSMKLLGEKYLKGKIYFVTDEANGTSFYFEHPLS